jgi:thioredoxin reductase (NADPH)
MLFQKTLKNYSRARGKFPGNSIIQTGKNSLDNNPSVTYPVFLYLIIESIKFTKRPIPDQKWKGILELGLPPIPEIWNFYTDHRDGQYQLLIKRLEATMLNLSGLSTSKPEIQNVKVLILGAGPAGLSAALYAARADLQPLVLTGLQLGGQVSLTNTIENYPGFPEGVGGAELGELFQKQAERFGARVEFNSALSVNLSTRPFKVTTDNGEYTADTLIISTGASPNLLNIPGETGLTGRGVSYCATCDGWFFKDKKVVVVGGGDSALEEGLFLTRFASSVTIIHRRESLRGGVILQKRALDNSKIKFVWNTIVTEVVGEERVESLKIKNLQTGEVGSYPTNGLFIFIGHTPNTQIFTGQLEMENGYIKVDDRMHTSVPGVYAAGESADSHFKQVITSAGMGAAAAIEATRFLEQEAG